MRAVQFDAIETREMGLFGAVDELLDGIGDLSACHFARCSEHHPGGNASDIAGAHI